ncbi:MAG: O-methyltransferase [Bacteroidaceae bacterium]|nr:O-methyltransferase [Bacteroidaceae bacterium]
MSLSGQGIGYTGEDVLEDYISRHISPESGLLESLYRETNLAMLNPRMVSGHIQGRVIKMLVSMIRPSNVLEVGTFTGYATLCIAEALPPYGRIHTVEIDDEKEDFIRKWIDSSPYSDRIILHIGDALEVVPSLGEQFDMAFIDGEKREYPEYWDKLFPYIKKGGFIIVDNTLWDGHVADSRFNDEQTEAIRKFNDMVASDRRVEVAIIPIRDGLSVIRKNEN